MSKKGEAHTIGKHERMVSRNEMEDFSPDMLVNHLSAVLDGEIGDDMLDEVKRNKISGRTF